jgi:large subunit ribosomal protein L18
MYLEKKVKRNKMTNILYQKRAARIRKKLKKINSERFRLTVFRSSRNISAQIIDNKNGKTLVSASSINEKSTNKKKADLCLLVAGTLVKRALENKITKIYFDRGRYKYHGRIKIFAEAVRKGGLTF